jgi:hypothetical protein
MRSVILIIAFLAASVIRTPRAHANDDAGAVIVIGSVPDKDRVTVTSAVRAAARGASWDLVETPIDQTEIQTIVACLKSPRVWSCIDPLAKSKQVGRWIIVRVEPDRSPDGTPAVTLTEQILLHGSDLPTTDRRYCAAGCSDEALTRVAFDLTKSLLEEASAGTSRTKVTIRTTPTGAWITLDGNNVGLTDHTYATFPGRHVIVVQRAGFEPKTQTVEIPEDRETSVVFELTPTGAAGSSHAYLLPGVVTGAGTIMFAAGLGLQLTKDPPDTRPQPARLVSTPGVGLMIAGGVAVGVGVVLWIRASKKSARPSSAPSAAFTKDGASLGWAGTF